MVVKVINKNQNKFYFKLGVFILIFSVLCVSLLNALGMNVDKTYEKGNGMYAHIVDYAFPCIKIANSKKQNINKDTYSLKSFILSAAGLDVNNPENIISKEVSFLGEVLPKSMKSECPNESFTLDDKDVVKTTSGSVQNEPSKNVNENVYDPKLKKTLDKSKPEILIYHSHTTEAYKPYPADSLNPTQSVCAVGDELVKELGDKYGIYAINDKTVHNVVDYNKSYTRSGETLDRYLKQYGDFKMIIDMHRDSDVPKSKVTARINGEDVAKFMFVMTRKNPHFDKNMALVNGLVSICNKDFPGIFNGIYYYDYGINYYNQQKSNNAFLLEVGSDINTIDEAKGTSKYLARIIAEYLNGKK
ncbi:stage II sporulation protein P [Clostridium felsineum]|uniref:Uncharacterized protein n=1 Tax=Clostridium felsineum TaxID=36839 RepID=A0A1S8LAV0_9CLOT|nr:stage II sporulation protein P [Clostridium felsineum]MCR3758208.1 stage II sporulation protein P [Clostridium felsineum]URZ06083.1 hypothetical protein CLROS_014160 [Clostridium felsineum]URZ11120.1 hypothetical protein CROST_018370 [Clostridium felsineum]URZ15748.1 hypothetical protein CLFE_017950 [Clostridium felsineum DSM 794]